MTTPALGQIWQYYMRASTPEAPPDAAIQGLMDKGVISNTNTDWNNFWGLGHPGEPVPYYVDPKGLPTTKYGDITSIRQVGGPFDLRDKSIQYNDPNYGQITPSQNTIDPSSQKNWMDYIGPLAVGLVTAGAGGLPWFANAGLSAAKMLGSGSFNPLALATSALPGLSEFGIPKEVLSGISLANSAKGLYSALTPQASNVMKTQAAPQQQQPTDMGYYPTEYGNMGSVANIPDGSQHVASGVAPNAYDNSYNTQVIS